MHTLVRAYGNYTVVVFHRWIVNLCSCSSERKSSLLPGPSSVVPCCCQAIVDFIRNNVDQSASVVAAAMLEAGSNQETSVRHPYSGARISLFIIRARPLSHEEPTSFPDINAK